MGETGRHDQTAGLGDILSAPVIKRSVTIAGHATSVSLEKPFWDRLSELAKKQGISVNALIAQIDDARDIAQQTNLSSALRLYVLHHSAPRD